MLLLDVNVVLAAQRADHPQHDVVRRWFDDLLAGDEPFTVATAVWASFLRITTNRRIFEVPSPLNEAFEFIDAVRAHPNHRLWHPGRAIWSFCGGSVRRPKLRAT